jgi:alpha-ribazole phosphatase/probable phosphoglycerate mutase
MAGKPPPASSVCTLVLVRHAASRGAGKFVGQQDEPLSAEGRRQLKELARKLSRFRFQAIFASDLRRAIATARPVAERQKVELQIRPGLREMHFGRWQGLSWEQIRRRAPRAADRWLKHFASESIPGAERLPRFKRRVKSELRAIVSANQGRCVLVVTHAGVIRVALADALGMTDENIFRLAVEPCGLNVLDDFSGSLTVRCVNA